MEEQGRVLSEIKNGIGIISFYHTKSNSLPQSLLKDLTAQVNKFSEDKKVHIIQLQSEGTKVFCAGAYFDELLDIKTAEEGKTFFMGFANLLNAMRKSPKLIITRVQGKVAGGGVGVVAASDYVLASSTASLKLSELSLGIGPFVIFPPIEHRIGKRALMNLTINTGWVEAKWALNNGLYSEMYDSQEELNNALEDHVLRLSDYNPEAITRIKELSWQGAEDWDELLEKNAQISGELVLSPFTKKFIRAFKKR